MKASLIRNTHCQLWLWWTVCRLTVSRDVGNIWNKKRIYIIRLINKYLPINYLLSLCSSSRFLVGLCSVTAIPRTYLWLKTTKPQKHHNTTRRFTLSRGPECSNFRWRSLQKRWSKIFSILVMYVNQTSLCCDAGRGRASYMWILSTI